MSGQKFIDNAKSSQCWLLWKPEGCGQTELPDKSVLRGQKLVEKAKIQKFKCDILGDFQTLCIVLHTFFTFESNSVFENLQGFAAAISYLETFFYQKSFSNSFKRLSIETIISTKKKFQLLEWWGSIMERPERVERELERRCCCF